MMGWNGYFPIEVLLECGYDGFIKGDAALEEYGVSDFLAGHDPVYIILHDRICETRKEVVPVSPFLGLPGAAEEDLLVALQERLGARVGTGARGLAARHSRGPAFSVIRP